ncbi:MAG: hypothetical protein P1V36_00975 [Planctomycetota bacterium]|nr:hypothetical protein [Planctomycetota bacterium]
MSTSPDPKRRFWIRATLVAGMLLAALGLWAVIQGSPLGRAVGPDDANEPPPLPADTKRHVRVRDPDGQVVAGAAAFVKQDPANPAEVSWHPEPGVLVLPTGGVDYPVRVIAPGFRVQDIPAVRGGQTIRLRPGYVAKVPLRGVPPDGLPGHVRFLLRVVPRTIRAQGIPPQEIVDLMGNLGGPGSGPEHIPRGEFGYPLSREQAEAGIVLPSPGTYHVHWGLIDVKASTWYSLGDRCGRPIEVADTDAPQSLPLGVTLEDLQETLDELARGVEAAKDMKK